MIMTRTLLTLITLATLLPLGASAQTAPSSLQGLTDETWEVTQSSIVTYNTTSGDTALVIGGTMIRALVDDTTYVACPDIGAPMFIPREDLVASADSVLYYGADPGINGTFMLRAECITTIGASIDAP